MRNGIVDVVFRWPEGITRQALEAAWWDGARTGAIAAAVALIVVYLIATARR